MGSSINIDQLGAAVTKALADEMELTEEVVADAVKQTATATVKEIRAKAKAEFPDGTGDYAKSWTQKVDGSLKKTGKIARIVFAKAPFYRLTHLLENGHAKVNGGRVEGRPHVAPAAEKAAKMLPELIETGIERGGL